MKLLANLANSILIALAVYVIGGIAYQRNVMHQRGWRQIPNYSMWAGIGSFCKVSFRTAFRYSYRVWRYTPIYLLFALAMSLSESAGSAKGVP